MPEKKIFIFSSVHFWNDTRIFYKEAQSLVKKYEVELHAPADFKFRDINGIRIYGLPKWKRVADRRKIRKEIWKRIRKSNADIFHFHDPELIFIGFYIKLIKRRKVIYDVHENVRASILTKDWIAPYKRIIISWIYRLIEKFAIIIFDKIVLAEFSYSEFINRNYIYILNYPVINCIGSDPYLKETDVIYVGRISKIRNIFEMLLASKFVANKFPKFKMKIIGPIEYSIENEIYSFNRKNNLGENITITGPLDHKSAMKEIKKSKIGLALLSPQKNYVKSMSTKIFEYMASEIPVIASNFPLWKGLINRERCGLTVNPQNVEEIVKAIIYLLQNSTVANQMGKNGKKAVEIKYNWEIEEKKLFKLFDDIA